MRWPPQFAILMLMSAAVSAQDVSLLYSESDLQQIGNRYTPNLRGMWDEDFLSRLTIAERLQAGAVSLYLPLVGANRYPLDFYSDPVRRQVFLPIASVKFIDDISLAFAYYQRIGCDVGLVSDYVAVLRFRPQQAKGSPLDTLGVPRTAINDPIVDDVAQKILKSIIFFVAAHEYAHVMYQHKNYDQITAGQAQQQEIEADAFALEIMRRIGVPPSALTVFFLTASRLEASPGDFNSPAAYEDYVRQRATHPVSALRILNLAQGIEDHIEAFTVLQTDPASWKSKLQTQVVELRQIGNTLDDRSMRSFLAQRAQTVDIASFRRACGH